jgi:hypothetical protein
MEPFQGYGVYTLPSHTVATEQMVESLDEASRGLGMEPGKITIGQEEVPFISELDFAPFQKRFPGVPLTPLKQAVRESLQTFVDQCRRGWLTRQQVSLGR